MVAFLLQGGAAKIRQTNAHTRATCAINVRNESEASSYMQHVARTFAHAPAQHCALKVLPRCAQHGSCAKCLLCARLAAASPYGWAGAEPALSSVAEKRIVPRRELQQLLRRDSESACRAPMELNAKLQIRTSALKLLLFDREAVGHEAGCHRPSDGAAPPVRRPHVSCAARPYPSCLERSTDLPI